MDFIKSKVISIVGNNEATISTNANKDSIPQAGLSDSLVEELPNASGISLLEQSQVEAIIDDDLFHGFDEPFIVEKNKSSDNQPSKQSNPITVGSAEWSRGWATDANGRIVHVSFIYKKKYYSIIYIFEFLFIFIAG